jgi:acylphosphatase
MKKRLVAVVMGTVQGVGYRYWAIQRASGLDLTGYVQNMPDGNVKVVAEGEDDTLRQFAELMKRGPAGAYVREVVATYLPATGEYWDFRVKH